jgi:hypothetical protein
MRRLSARPGAVAMSRHPSCRGSGPGTGCHRRSHRSTIRTLMGRRAHTPAAQARMPRGDSIPANERMPTGRSNATRRPAAHDAPSPGPPGARCASCASWRRTSTYDIPRHGKIPIRVLLSLQNCSKKRCRVSCRHA